MHIEHRDADSGKAPYHERARRMGEAAMYLVVPFAIGWAIIMGGASIGTALIFATYVSAVLRKPAATRLADLIKAWRHNPKEPP